MLNICPLASLCLFTLHFMHLDVSQTMGILFKVCQPVCSSACLETLAWPVNLTWSSLLVQVAGFIFCYVFQIFQGVFLILWVQHVQITLIALKTFWPWPWFSDPGWPWQGHVISQTHLVFCHGNMQVWLTFHLEDS